jgi:hypothetical protein
MVKRNLGFFCRRRVACRQQHRAGVSLTRNVGNVVFQGIGSRRWFRWYACPIAASFRA